MLKHKPSVEVIFWKQNKTTKCKSLSQVSHLLLSARAQQVQWHICDRHINGCAATLTPITPELATYLNYPVMNMKASLLVRWTFFNNLGYKDPFVWSAVIVILWNRLLSFSQEQDKHTAYKNTFKKPFKIGQTIFKNYRNKLPRNYNEINISKLKNKLTSLAS